MSRCVHRSVRACGATLLTAIAWLGLPAAGEAQTTVKLDAPGTESIDTTIQGGSFANSNFDRQALMTRASDNLEYARRALLKFDTETQIPYKAKISSATLTLTVMGGNDQNRTLSLYRVVSSFDQDSATWKKRKSGYSWSKSGGDLGKKYAAAAATGKVGSRVTFDVTTLVQEMVNSGDGRWTRVAIVDEGPSTYLSYREFHPSEAKDASVRPVLTVVYGGSGSAQTPAPAPAPVPPPPSAPQPPPESTPVPAPPPPPSGGGSTLKLLHWNSHHGGRRTDGVTDTALFVNWIVKLNPHVISLNEIDNQSQATTIANLLKAKTGVSWAWYYDGRGNQLLTRLPQPSESACVVNPGVGRKAAHIGVIVNGRPINVWSAHLGLESSKVRTSETNALRACEKGWAEARIAAGDFNMQADTAEYKSMLVEHADAWKAAPSKSNYSGNCDGCTRNSRIDYVFTSKGAPWLVLKSVQIPDTRAANGVMPSDHKPMLVTYEVR